MQRRANAITSSCELKSNQPTAVGGKIILVQLSTIKRTCPVMRAYRMARGFRFPGRRRIRNRYSRIIM